MPKVTITDGKGLVQEAGSGVDVQSTTTFKKSVKLNGQSLGGMLQERVVVSPGTSGFSGADCMLSASHSGKTILLGDHSAIYTVHIPAVAGWKARFTLTGSQAAVLTNNIFLTASAGFSALGTATPFKGMLLDAAGAAATDIVFLDEANNANTGVEFIASSGVQAGDFVDVEVITTTTTPTISCIGNAQD
jgi:hypothetical protein